MTASLELCFRTPAPPIYSHLFRQDLQILRWSFRLSDTSFHFYTCFPIIQLYPVRYRSEGCLVPQSATTSEARTGTDCYLLCASVVYDGYWWYGCKLQDGWPHTHTSWEMFARAQVVPGPGLVADASVLRAVCVVGKDCCCCRASATTSWVSGTKRRRVPRGRTGKRLGFWVSVEDSSGRCGER